MAKLIKALKSGVTVEVIAGKEKGKTGQVQRVLAKQGRVIVEKLNMQKRHSRPSSQSQTGGIIDKEGSIAISNLKVVEAAPEPKAVKKGNAKKAKKKAEKSK